MEKGDRKVKEQGNKRKQRVTLVFLAVSFLSLKNGLSILSDDQEIFNIIQN